GVAAREREVESIDGELARQTELIVQKEREKAAIIARYDADKQRWRELVATRPANGFGKSVDANPAAAVAGQPATGLAKSVESKPGAAVAGQGAVVPAKK